MKKIRYDVFPVEGGGSWYVVITPEEGPEEKWFGFLSEAQARDWIRRKRTEKV